MRAKITQRLDAAEARAGQAEAEYCLCGYRYETAIALIAPAPGQRSKIENCPECGRPLRLVFEYVGSYDG